MSPGLTSFHGERRGDSGLLGGPGGHPRFRALSPTTLYRLSPLLRPLLAEKAVVKAVGAEQAPGRGRQCPEGLRGMTAPSPRHPPCGAVPISQTRGALRLRRPRSNACQNPAVKHPAVPLLGHHAGPILLSHSPAQGPGGTTDVETSGHPRQAEHTPLGTSRSSQR